MNITVLNFSIKICASDILHADASALQMGMQLAWRQGFKVEFESDNSHLISILQSGLAPISKVVVIQQIHELGGMD